MEPSIDLRFDEERERYALRFTCEACAYFDPARARCAHGYPCSMHRAAAFALVGPRNGSFCKEFEPA